MNAIGYIRVSTEEQINGVSLEAQEAKIRAWCTLHDAELVAVYRDEGISGYKGRECRPGLDTALKQAGGGLLQTGLHTLRGVRHPSAARTSLLSPRAMAWAEATQSHVAWRARAGANGGGSAASCRWQSIVRITSAWVNEKPVHVFSARILALRPASHSAEQASDWKAQLWVVQSRTRQGERGRRPPTECKIRKTNCG